MSATASQDASPVVALRVHVPLACFRKPHAREYWETYPIAPPSTVFGMLLSMVGEPNRLRHQGARVVVARLVESAESRVLRTFYRWKSKDITAGQNRSPDWQALLSDVRLAVWIADGVGEPAAQDGDGTLRERVRRHLAEPSTTERFGALSLGESTHLVDGVWWLGERPVDEAAGECLERLAPEPSGRWSLPLWPDHVGSAGTRWGRFALRTEVPVWSPGEDDWSVIAPPER